MIDIKVDDKAVRDMLAKLEKKTKNLRPVLAEIGEMMHDDVMENFEQEGRPNKWVSLRPSTIKQREREGKWPGKILQRHGASGGLISKINSKATNTEVVLGTKSPYAAALHYGFPKRKLPPRPFMTLSDVVKADISRTLQRYLEKK